MINMIVGVCCYVVSLLFMWFFMGFSPIYAFIYSLPVGLIAFFIAKIASKTTKYDVKKELENGEEVILEGQFIRNFIVVPIVASIIGLIVCFNAESAGKHLEPIIIGITLVVVAFIWLIFFRVNNCSLIITDRRILGKAEFGKVVNLPISAISAVGLSNLLKGVYIGTSSGRISFDLVKNANEVFGKINSMIDNKPNTINAKKENISETEKLKEYKQLLDEGVITNEEFEAKKKQLLGL